MLRFSIDVAGVQVLDRSFNRIDRFVSDFRNLWPEVIKEFYAIEEKQFDTEGSQGASGRWARLSPAYAKLKAVKHPNQSILRATRGLYESLTDSDAPDAILRPEKDQLTIGTKHPAGIHHQRGTGRMPPRPPISLTERDNRTMQKAIQKGLVRFAREVGFIVNEKAA